MLGPPELLLAVKKITGSENHPSILYYSTTYCGSLRHMELVCQREITGSSTESWFASFDNGIKARGESYGELANELKCHHNRKVEFHWEKFVRNAQKRASFWRFFFSRNILNILNVFTDLNIFSGVVTIGWSIFR